MARCARWADGVYAWSGNGETTELQQVLDLAEREWQNAGRDEKPYRLGGFWYTLADNGQQRLYDYVFDYLAIAGEDIARMMADSVHRSTPDAVMQALDNVESAGCEEVFLVPATADLAEVDRLADLVSRR
jgi:hypothetical protein